MVPLLLELRSSEVRCVPHSTGRTACGSKRCDTRLQGECAANGCRLQAAPCCILVEARLWQPLLLHSKKDGVGGCGVVVVSEGLAVRVALSQGDLSLISG